MTVSVNEEEKTISTFFKDEKVLIKEFGQARNLQKSSLDGYLSTLKLYTEYCHKNLGELIEEAHTEEDLKIPARSRKIKQRLLGYRSLLLDRGMAPRTARGYFVKIKTFYSHFEVELPQIPPFKWGLDYQTHYDDLPKKEHIIEALKISKQDMRALILFMSTSGTAKAETLSLTVGDFVDATSEYHNDDGLDSILETLGGRFDVVPTWYLKRIKTSKYYYTFNHPLATIEIVKYLKTRVNLDLIDKLFPFTSSLVLERFQRINDYFCWGFKGKYRFFRAHTLRKYHASNIGLPADQIDSLQGRSKNVVHETYIKPNPIELKKIYMDAMHRIEINLEEGDNVDGVEALKKYKNLPPRVRTEGKPVFEDGDFKGIEPASRVVDDESVNVNQDCSTVEKSENISQGDEKPPTRETVKTGQIDEQPQADHNTLKKPDRPSKRTCKYCDARVYNSQTICGKCKEKRFKEVWEELLKPLLEKQDFFVKKDVEDIDFPMTLNNSLAWYIENKMLTVRKNGKINEYYRPTPEEIQEKEVPGITKRCRDCEKIKPIKEFYKQKRSPDGYAYICITCDKKRNQNRPRMKQDPDQKQHLQQILINDMQKQNQKGQPIKIHLYLLKVLEKYVESE